jgi:uncharacterized protein with PhoU and TrkA domain
MSGAEALAVLGAVSAVISIIDATKQVYDAASDQKGLPSAFVEVAGRRPIVHNILRAAEDAIRKDNVNEDPVRP